jgi:hypothetical protein
MGGHGACAHSHCSYDGQAFVQITGTPQFQIDNPRYISIPAQLRKHMYTTQAQFSKVPGGSHQKAVRRRFSPSLNQNTLSSAALFLKRVQNQCSFANTHAHACPTQPRARSENLSSRPEAIYSPRNGHPPTVLHSHVHQAHPQAQL